MVQYSTAPTNCSPLFRCVVAASSGAMRHASFNDGVEPPRRRCSCVAAIASSEGTNAGAATRRASKLFSGSELGQGKHLPGEENDIKEQVTGSHLEPRSDQDDDASVHSKGERSYQSLSDGGSSLSANRRRRRSWLASVWHKFVVTDFVVQSMCGLFYSEWPG